ncbi:MAG: hypothetical protein K6E62_12910 [Lachnospiraceae bacterium]|nr:hypothetical protein [Lachnospiraceae bacterium]
MSTENSQSSKDNKGFLDLDLSEPVSSEPVDLDHRIKELSKTIGEMMERMPDYSKMLSSLAEMSKRILDQIDFSAMYNSLSHFGDVIADIVGKIHFPTITEERKQELLENYRQWGEYGWTINPCEEGGNLFNNEPPKLLKDADRMALKNCNDMEGILGFIRSDKRAKKTDFNEAVASFNDGRYKSCAMIMFSLVDAQLIRLQRNEETCNKRRSVGAGAIKRVKKRAGLDEGEELLWIALFYTNVFSCLETMFADGNDFKVQPKIINRNFLDHGMMTGRVSRKSCIQLFLLYYNMLEMLEMLY